MTTFLLMSILLLQVCQVIRLEMQLTSNDTNRRADRMSNFAGQGSDYHPGILRSHVGGTSSSTPIKLVGTQMTAAGNENSGIL